MYVSMCFVIYNYIRLYTIKYMLNELYTGLNTVVIQSQGNLN